MQRFFNPTLFLMLIVVLLIGNALADSGQGIQMPEGYNRSDKLPPGFLALVPQGYAINSPQLVKYGNMGSVSFVANKQFEGRHSVYFSEYHLDLNIKESTNQLIKMQAPMYRTQLEQDIETKMSSRRKDESDAITGYDQPQLTKYPWGAGITQRIVHKYMGAGKNADEIEYSCVYLGLIVDDQSIKKFQLSVSGVETRAEADQWAEKVAEKIGKTGLNNFGDK